MRKIRNRRMNDDLVSTKVSAVKHEITRRRGIFITDSRTSLRQS